MAMTGMLNTLILELQADETLRNHPVVQTYIIGASNALNSKEPDAVYETFLNNLEAICDYLEEKKETVKELVKKKKEALAKTDKKKGKSHVGDAKLKEKVKKIRESHANSDPVVKTACDKLDEALDVMPEFKSIVPFIRIFEGYRYDSVVKVALDEVNSFLESNRSRIMIADTVFELSKTKSGVFSKLCETLEACLDAGETSADAIKMRLRDLTSLPIATRLVNALSMNEAQAAGTFDIGIGSQLTSVTPVISPYMKDGKKEFAFIDAKLYVIKESDEDSSDPTTVVTDTDTKGEGGNNPHKEDDTEDNDDSTDPELISQNEYHSLPVEFKKACESFYYLGFKEIEGKFVSTNTRKIKIQLAVNEKQKIEVYLNGSKVEDPTKVNITELGLMESIESRKLLADFFESLGFMANIQNIKRIRNTQYGKETYAIGFDSSVYLLEKGTPNEKFLKVSPIGFHRYVLENYQYDVRDLYSIRLGEAEEVAYSIDSEKMDVEKDITKLEEAATKVIKALENKDLDAPAIEHLTNLSESIEKSIIQLKNRYVQLDLAKKN